MSPICEICGNDRLPGAMVCRFCGTKSEKDLGSKPAGPFHRVVNLEYGKPLVEEALSRLARELERARNEETAVLTIIHGYGSSGTGGAIRKECRKTLEYLECKGQIKNFILGERFSRKEGSTRVLLRRYPQLGSNSNLNKGNRGVTLVVVK